MNIGNQRFDLPEPEEATLDDPKRDIRIGLGIAILFFVVLLGWAALTPLDAAVRASGVISVSGNRQAVQHPTGGVVTALNVKEGQMVQSGAVLVELSAPETKAAERALTSDYLMLLAQRARLAAEQAGRSSLTPPAEYADLRPEDRPLAQQALRMQMGELRARSSSMSAQQSVLSQRERQLAEQGSGYSERRKTMVEQRRILDEELKGLRSIAEKGFASKNRVRALERAEAELRGQEAAMTAEMARAGEGMGETRMQSLSLVRSTQEEIATNMRETEARLSETLPKLIAVREQLERAQIRATATGRVVGLNVFTVGGVVAPGQTLMEIVPEDRRLVVQAQVNPADADNVYAGQEAQLHFESVRDKNLPLMNGTVTNISADSFSDEKTGQRYFRAEIEVPREDFEMIQRTLGQGQLRPGLPVDAMLSVRKRSALEYLLEPLTSSFRHALHEE
ncbi:HlyD family type I secretion periplasmic adaptor subunit [Sphingomonas sabuli]|uniref:Membrane fusion protein (MFP) family protein n=1 Tax=Sphingomonas sabuli TaxID=2764186 RepID=A0A7G9L587_9SPHN|nr:HlyD family type I secretion periplasmic adaptor subunit [Sphingomonas sabuli]QNM83786.1 HlyD family type I secretion periplasmic adaptor subunit [Sphingomonas sabuli]